MSDQVTPGPALLPKRNGSEVGRSIGRTASLRAIPANKTTTPTAILHRADDLLGT